MFGSLFIVTGKRYAELREIGDDAAAVRATLADYSAELPAHRARRRRAARRSLSYCQWAFETSDRTAAEWPFYELSIVPMLTALLRYALVLEQGRGAAPEEVFASDRVLQLLGAGVGGALRPGRVRAMTRRVDEALAAAPPTSRAG